MKKIKIFLASSISDLKIDRLEIGDFIRQLNDLYIERDLYFSLVKCEDYDNSIAAAGKQSEFDKEIEDSEVVFFLFFRKVGDYTRHEFEVAYDAYSKKLKPKIVTYFKYVNSPDEATGEVKKFMDVLDVEIKHFYNTYSSIDTLKLGIFMQLKLLKLDVEQPTIENGKIMCANIEVGKIENIPMFVGNESIQHLRSSLKNCEAEYYRLQEKYLTAQKLGKFDKDLHEDYSNIASEKARIEERLKLAEKAVLEITADMIEKTASGKLSERQIAAYHALEAGNYWGARNILDFNAIMTDVSHNEMLADNIKERLQANVNELLLRTEIMMSDGIDKGETEELTTIFETAIKISEKYNLDKSALYQYTVYLRNQNNTPKALQIAERLRRYEILKNEDAGISDYETAEMLGLLYLTAKRYDKSEEELSRAFKIIEKLSGKKTLFRNELARAYKNFADLYLATGSYKKAKDYYIEALKVFRIYYGTNLDPDYSKFLLIESYNNLGTADLMLGNYDSAELKFKEAEKLCNGMPQSDWVIMFAGTTYLNLARILQIKDIEANKKEIEQYLVKAKENYKRLAEKNPEAYEMELANVYVYICVYYLSLALFKEAKQFLNAAINILKRFKERGIVSSGKLFLLEIARGFSCFTLADTGDENQIDSEEADGFYCDELPDVLDILLDEDNTDPLNLQADDGRLLSMEQVAVIPFNERIYCILKPINMSADPEDQIIVLYVDEEEGEEPKLVVETDQVISLQIWSAYIDLISNTNA